LAEKLYKKGVDLAKEKRFEKVNFFPKSKQEFISFKGLEAFQKELLAKCYSAYTIVYPVL